MMETFYLLTPKLTMLGLLDADNYTPILILLFILATPRGGKDAFWFTIGVILMQLAGGFLFAHAILAFGETLSPDIQWLLTYGQILFGVFLVLIGLFWRPRQRAKMGIGLLKLGHRPITWFAVGVFVEITKLMTSVVYFDAVRRVLSATGAFADRILLLGYFNVIAFSPLLLIWIVYLSVGISKPKTMANIRLWIVEREPLLIRFAFVAVGVFLVFNGYGVLGD